jgi:hypothetical protein
VDVGTDVAVLADVAVKAAVEVACCSVAGAHAVTSNRSNTTIFNLIQLS